ncbi:MAG: hypothetical protein JWN33_185 [Candidatus Saccharibacteria bacterium]|nr:hypothetical protein [Candidatus Saccharibacteria bacterium]
MFKPILTLVALITSVLAVFIAAPLLMAAPYGAGKYNSNVPYGAETQLSISTSGPISLEITPSDTGTLGSASGTVTVVSTDVVGYKLYIRALNATTMVNGTANIPASSNNVGAALANNTWGYNLDASANFVGVTSSDTLIRNATQPYTTGDVMTVTYGAKFDRSKPSGNYSTTVIYTAVPQTN